MSLFRFGNFEKDIDFTDADFLDAIDDAYQMLQDDVKSLPVVGKISDIVRAQNACYDAFLNSILGVDASVKMFETNSLLKRIEAVEALANMRERDEGSFNARLDGYVVNKPGNGNREQRRMNQKKQKNHNNRNNYSRS